jgi:hypothetical protein
VVVTTAKRGWALKLVKKRTMHSKQYLNCRAVAWAYHGHMMGAFNDYLMGLNGIDEVTN